MDKFIIFPRIEGSNSAAFESALAVSQIESCSTDGSRGYVSTAKRSATVKETDMELMTTALSRVEWTLDHVLHWNELVAQASKELGQSQPESEQPPFGDLLNKSQGLILFVGNTGSGKTKLLGDAAQYFAAEGESVVAVKSCAEDALSQKDLHAPGSITQIEWDDADVSFAKAHAMALHMDPDILIYDELRNAEHTSAAFNSALTGHLVLASIHAQDLEHAKNAILNRYPVAEQAVAKLLWENTVVGAVEAKRADGDEREFSHRVVSV